MGAAARQLGRGGITLIAAATGASKDTPPLVDRHRRSRLPRRGPVADQRGQRRHWRGRSLETHEVVVETIAATTTKTGLSIQAALDTNTYPKGVRITDKAMKASEASHLQRHKFHGNWNYTVTGAPADNTTRSEGQE